MNELAKSIGQRIRNYRTKLGLTQENLAELSGCHPTYIGQLERGEKNATLESIEKISHALHIPLAQLFEKLDNQNISDENIPLQCYEFFATKSNADQERLYRILLEIDKYKNN